MARAVTIAQQANPHVWGFKVRDLIYHYGVEIVYELKQFGNVIADARLNGDWRELTEDLRIFRNAGADIITVTSPAGAGDPGDDLACFGFEPNEPYAYSMLRGVIINRKPFDVFLSRDDTPLVCYGRSILAAENLAEELQKLNEQSLGQK